MHSGVDWGKAIYAQEANSPEPQPTELIHSVHAALLPTRRFITPV